MAPPSVTPVRLDSPEVRALIEVDKALPVQAQKDDTQVGGRDLNITSVAVLAQRINNAREQGGVNVAISHQLLTELLAGCAYAMKNGWVSELKI